MKRVNWEAKSEFQYIENYKILQAAFTKQCVQKRVDVDRLIRAKYQDNLEFCQWLKAFFEHASSDTREDYDAIARRSMGKGGKRLDDIFLPRGLRKIGGGKGTVTGGSAGAGSASSARSSTFKQRSGASVSSSRSVSSRSNVGTSYTASSKRSSAAPLRDGNSRPSAKKAIASEAASQKIDQLKSENESLAKQNGQLRRKNAESELILENIERERDFYFDKLRGIEVMLQVHEETGEESDPEALIQRIFKVLYAKTEDNIVVTDDGELLENITEGGGEDLLNESNISMLSNDPGAEIENEEYLLSMSNEPLDVGE